MVHCSGGVVAALQLGGGEFFAGGEEEPVVAEGVDDFGGAVSGMEAVG